MENSTLEKLQRHEKMTDEECFSITLEISKGLNSKDTSTNTLGRNLLIRVLDNWNNIPESYKTILTDLISAAGFYPYIQEMNLSIDDVGEEIRMAYHKSDNLENKFFHAEQKHIDELIKKHVNVIVSAPTSFGKSMLIEEVVASREYSNIVIIQPTLALLDETRRKLKKYTDRYKIIVKTTQEFSSTKGNIFLLTAERVLEYPNMPPIQLLVIDEFYKLSSTRRDNRSSILNTAFIRLMKNPDCRFYMLGPNIDSIPSGFIEKYNAVFYQTDFSMVIADSDNRHENVRHKSGGKVEEEDLFSILDTLEEQTLIYCSSPASARKLAFLYCAHLISQGKEPIEDLPLVGWINDNLSYRWSLTKCLQYEIAFVSVDEMFKLFPREMQGLVDSIIERVFALQKNWLQYRAPKWINAVDSLQKYATQKLGLRSGDYSYVAEMIENEFIQSSLRILLEYGVPLSAVQKIQIILQMHKVNTNTVSEDKAIEIIFAHREAIRPYLSVYEMEILDRAI